MLTFKLIIHNANACEDIVHHTYNYLYMLSDTGQILKREHLLVQRNNTIEIAVACPEMDSLDDKYCNQYGLEYKQKIEIGTGHKIKYELTDTEPDYPFPRYAVNPEKSSFYVLHWGWSSPLLCGDTYKPIPLYKLPYTDELNNDYSNVNSWERHHQSLYRLWLSSQETTEQFAIDQLQNVYSEHNKVGRELCKHIEELTDIPTYYFLFNYRNWTLEEDMDRKCPITGNEWRIEGKTTSDFYTFKCDESRLLSELSTNCYNEDGV